MHARHQIITCKVRDSGLSVQQIVLVPSSPSFLSILFSEFLQHDLLPRFSTWKYTFLSLSAMPRFRGYSSRTANLFSTIRYPSTYPTVHQNYSSVRPCSSLRLDAWSLHPPATTRGLSSHSLLFWTPGAPLTLLY